MMHPVVRKLNIFASLSPEEASAIGLVCSDIVELPAHRAIAREDEPAINVFLLLEGFVARHKMLPSGRRQILAFMTPGDTCDVGVTLLARRDHSLTTLAPSRLARVSDVALDHLMAEYPKIRAAFRWATLIEEGTAREWILNLGAREAVGRMAHVFCEVYYRLNALGLANGLNYELPLTQQDLADTIGISSVHANRTLQELRRRKLISFGDRRLNIRDLKGLEEVAQFEPTYLHLDARYDEKKQFLGRRP